MKVIVAGSRSIKDYQAVHRALVTAPFPKMEIVSGGAAGVDSLGEQWAEKAAVPVVRFPADWEKFGKGAGYLRNVQMADYADALIAIWDGESKGTRHMIDIMLYRKKPIYVVFSS